MAKRIKVGMEMTYSRDEAMQLREEVIQLRDKALQEGKFKEVIILSHTIALLFNLINEVLPEERK